YVKAMKAGKRKERRAEQVGADRDAVREESQVLARLAEEKNRAEPHGQREPSADAAPIAPPEAARGQMNRGAAQKQADAERERATHVEAVGGTRSTGGPRLKERVRDHQDEEKPRLREKKQAHSHLGLVRHGVLRHRHRSSRQLRDDFVGAIRMSEVPQRPAPANRRNAGEVLRRRRRGSRPFQRPRIPWVVARYFS